MADTISAGRAVDESGYQYSNLPQKLAGEDLTNDVMKMEHDFDYAHINTATTTTVFSGSGFLHRIVITGGTAGAIEIYDSTAGSGQKIASFDSTSAPGSYALNTNVSVGLTIVTSAATKLTIIAREDV